MIAKEFAEKKEIYKLKEFCEGCRYAWRVRLLLTCVESRGGVSEGKGVAVRFGGGV